MDIRNFVDRRIADEDRPGVGSASKDGTITATITGGEIIIQFKAGLGAQAQGAVIGAVKGVAVEDMSSPGSSGLIRVTLGAGMALDTALAMLERNPNVVFAEPNYTLSLTAIANDPYYTGGNLWGMLGDQTSPANIFGSQAGEAWAAGYTGSTKVAIGVIDSGIDYTHPDLYLNVWLNQGEIPTAIRAALSDVDGDTLITLRDLNDAANAAYVSDLNSNGRIDAHDLLNDSRWENGTDQDGNGYRDDLIGWDFVNNDNDPYDDNSHGTHVSGTIAGMGGNGTGVAGVTWSTQIVGLKFLDASGSGSSSGAVQALDYYTWAGAHGSGVEFVATNNSWGGGGYSQALFDAIVRSAQGNALFVAAAGNGGADQVGDNNNNLPHYPSSYNTTSVLGWDSVIAVASITSSGARSSFSNYGSTTVELGAPGSAIISTVPGGGYASYSGTSMATPHVAGAIAMFAAAGTETAQQIRADLLASTTATSSLAGLTMTGGRLDVMKLMQLLGDGGGGGGGGGGGITGSPTTGSDTIIGTSGNDTLTGVPASGTHLGRATIDSLTGNGGNDLFVLGDSRGHYYDDGKSRTAGTSDYAVIKDFNAGDMIQLAGGLDDYLQRQVSYDGKISAGLYFDTNNNHSWDSRDELIGVVEGMASVDWSNFIFV